MKKLLLSSAGIGLALSAFAQLPVSHSPQNRKVLLEEFTGIQCGNCPDGHRMANELKAAKPAGSIVIANIHTTGYAQPDPGQPDFRTAEGNTIASIPGTNIKGVPMGSINRHKFEGQDGFALDTEDWDQYADSTLAKSSYVNIALQGTLEIATRQLTVNVEAYYTASSPVSTNKLTVMLLEDGVIGPQSGAQNNPAMFNPYAISLNQCYTHNHLLRKVLTTAATGEVIHTTTSGTTVTRTYTYTVPALYVNNAADLTNLRLIAFMAETDAEVITVAEGPLTVTGTDAKITLTAPAGGTRFCTAGTVPNKVSLKNTGSVALTSADIYYKAGAAAYQVYNWTGTLAAGDSTDVTLGNISLSDSGSVVVRDSVGKINGLAENNPGNNVAGTFVIGPSAAAALPIASSFENGPAASYGVPAGWLILNDQNKSALFSGSWWVSNRNEDPLTPYETAYDGSFVAYLAYFYIDRGTTAILTLPYANMPAGPKALDFYYAYAMRDTISDKFEVVYSTDCGTTWQSLWSKTGADLATTPATTINDFFVPKAKSQYRGISIDLTPVTGNALVGFRSTSNEGSAIWLDKVNLRTGAVTGIGEVLSSASLSLYPNPVKDQLNIELNIGKAAKVTFTIVNVVGQQAGQSLVKNFSQGTAKATMATHDLTPGIYFLNVITEKGSVQQKFVK